MDNTIEKLDEAVFFFNALRASFAQNDNASMYYLSAFVSASRSVTFFMQKEYSDKPGFKDWWDKNKPIKFKNFNDLRVITIHQSSVEMNNSHILDFGKGLIMKGGDVVTTEFINLNEPSLKKEILIKIESPDGAERIEKHVQKRDFTVEAYYEHEKEKKQIKFDYFLEEAENYLNTLVALVDECRKTFTI